MEGNKNIVLIGIPGSGKKTLGEKLANKLGREFINADAVVSEMMGKSVDELRAEGSYEAAETEAAKKIAAEKQGAVIACGGTVTKNPSNLDIYKTSGLVFFLDRSPFDIVRDKRCIRSGLLDQFLYKDGGVDAVFDLYDEYYEPNEKGADIVVMNKGILMEVLDKFITIVQNR